MRSFKSSENIHKKEDGSYYVVSANKASSVTCNHPATKATGLHIKSAFNLNKGLPEVRMHTKANDTIIALCALPYT